MAKPPTCNIGDTFGSWTVIDNKLQKDEKSVYYVKVQCKCGHTQYARLSMLKEGTSTQCKKCRSLKSRNTIEIGKIYKGWKVLEGPLQYTQMNKRHKVYSVKYKCLCTYCDNIIRHLTSTELLHPTENFCCANCAQTLRKYSIKFNDKNCLKNNKIYSIKGAAKRRNIPYTLTKQFLWNLYLKQGRRCALTGDILPDINQASLDRIDSSKGYEEGNVQWVAVQANISKYTLSQEDFIKFCKKVVAYNEKDS